MIRANDHRALLDRMLAHYDLPASCLEIVPDAFAWCEARGIKGHSPHRAAVCFMDERHIVMQDEQTDDMIASSNSAMFYRGFLDAFEILDTDVKALVHLMLHEIACIVLRTTEQKPRDEWAFREMVRFAP